MNKKIATGLILIILSIVLLYLQFSIVSVVLFGIGITILGYEAMKSFLYKNVEEVPLIEKEPTKSIKDLPSLEEVKVENRYSEPIATIDHSKKTITVGPSEPGIRVLIKNPDDFLRLSTLTPKVSTGTKLVKPLVEEQLNPKFVKSVKKPRRNTKANSVGEKIVEQSKTRRKPRKPKLKKEE